MPRRGTADAIFETRQSCEKFMAKNQKLHRIFFVFFDLEKTFDKVPRKIIIEALMDQKIPQQLIKATMTTYDDCKTSVVV